MPPMTKTLRILSRCDFIVLGHVRGVVAVEGSNRGKKSEKRSKAGLMSASLETFPETMRVMKTFERRIGCVAPINLRAAER